MSDFPELAVPYFARLCDYAGLWLMEPNAFAFMWHRHAVTDLAAHIREKPAEPLKSAIMKQPGPGGKSIAEIQLVGTLMKGQSSMGGTSTVQARRDVRQAAADPEVAGILLRIDSPGGTVSGTYDLAADVKAAGRVKPVFAHIEDTGASAAYWVASQADHVTAANPTTLVGSIGTLQVIYDESGAMAAQGVKPIVLRTGPLKGLGMDKVTDEQVAHLQSLVDSVQTSFNAAVMKGRGMTQTQLNAVNHGGVFTASNAVDNRLIDGVQPFAKTMAQLNETIRTGKMPGSTASTSPGAVAGSLPMVRRGLPTLAARGNSR
jgi:signal peptide peptidase SppA